VGEPVDVVRFLKIARKRKERGRESLTDEERAYYHRGMRAFRPFLEKFAEWANDPGTQGAMDAYERMSPEDRERFGDWKPAELYAFLPLLEDEPEDEDVWA
jgi:hypothetical protein